MTGSRRDFPLKTFASLTLNLLKERFLNVFNRIGRFV
jgi:hypothetical protein